MIHIAILAMLYEGKPTKHLFASDDGDSFWEFGCREEFEQSAVDASELPEFCKQSRKRATMSMAKIWLQRNDAVFIEIQ